jgi:Flp pilus assembly pilin Flp
MFLATRLNPAEQLSVSREGRGQAASGERGQTVRRSLACFTADTRSGTTVEYGILAAGLAVTIVFALAHLGAEGRSVARTLLRLGKQ